MEINKCKCVFFSPTGTTKKIVNEIANGIGIEEKETIDFTKLAQHNQHKILFDNNELAIIGVPVYFGRIPIIAEKFIQDLKVEKTLSVIVVVYGNREYEDALIELKNFCEKIGFRTLAGGVFIGEHSMSSEKTPIAQGRPDEKDLKIANNFGKKLKEKIELIENSNSISSLSIPGSSKYKKRQRMPKAAPTTNKKLCTLCTKCIAVCPTGAITKDDSIIKTDKSKCIACYACIKTCPVEAREMKNQLFKIVNKKLYRTCKERKEPELYI
jgi:ferredoxin